VWTALSDDQIRAFSEDELRAELERLVQRARVGSVDDPVELSRAVAVLARALTQRSSNVTHVQTAVALLLEVTAGRVGKPACEALLERAKLLLVDLGQLADGERAARDVVERFSEDDQAGACVVAAQATVDALADQPAVIAAAASEARRSQPIVAQQTAADGAEIDSASWVQARASADGSLEAATLQRVTVYGGREGSRVVRAVLYLDRPAVYRYADARAEAGLPRRFYVDFDNIKLAPSVEATVPIEQGGLQRVRVLDLAGRPLAAAHATAGRMRVSFDVDEGVLHRLFFLSDPYRVVIDLQAPQPENLLAAKVRTIVLDPGHGGHDTGAHGPHGLREGVLALDLSRRVRSLLRHELPGTRVILTRETNLYLSLEERTAIANGENAQLFVSIHLNSWATSDQGGVATFVLDTSDDSQALRLAARENGTDVSEVSELQKVLAGLYRKEQVGQSLKLAEAIHQQILGAGRTVLPALSDRGVKRAMFYVLVGATMPAVLVEPSFITHPDEAQALTTERYRDQLAAGIAAGIVRYARSL
jgi:N-acetylmuramoyl-L-alanine amidase